ncbi:hypothetical protein [Streptomyces sp. GC420]|uniref:hypothetical protein n=1 Tax=Streptomyces sp. GC420 TaxID=2697568 RepID=UPI001415130F|nr:hypothetical protein [Streptomyces sp. GC420]NBM14338.1 hypothetical protein [Streptomyces sp. GC420]
MQHSALPDLALAHTQTRPVHWLATATALAAVVALSALIQPSGATANQVRAQSGPGPTPVAAPDPAAATFPMKCGTEGPEVVEHASGDLDGDGRPETVAVVRCEAGFGTPPSGVYVLTRAEEEDAPRVVATFVEPDQRLSVTEFAVRDGRVSATLLGYSSDEVPRCCPDVQERVNWQWLEGKFVRTQQAGAPAV